VPPSFERQLAREINPCEQHFAAFDADRAEQFGRDYAEAIAVRYVEQVLRVYALELLHVVGDA
jgi:hypothetical protein